MEQEAEEHKYVSLDRKDLQNPAGSALPYQIIGITPLQCSAYRLFCFRLVLETLNPLPENRKCFRMINGVLVERTVKDVIPALKTNSEGLKKVLDELLKQYKKQQDEMEKWKVNPTLSHCDRAC